ncbi:uncharacterized protein I303_101458 [Kwoniella dejecticola CBS 10117]|uniref:Uncharacterized protein n=1 Tax=Kwoniella dejecticola CBS 10117 TaxID=1296121 RepID=A0A1A6ADS1_9TREE|nr:uncharacterized protein I303_02409 [Kwoniella dejecticola CBS 10117]OBR88189.1 hypothetical protein I303_02409 [Kwoniella dejecticola CBS 10117]
MSRPDKPFLPRDRPLLPDDGSQPVSEPPSPPQRHWKPNVSHRSNQPAVSYSFPRPSQAVEQTGIVFGTQQTDFTYSQLAGGLQDDYPSLPPSLAGTQSTSGPFGWEVSSLVVIERLVNRVMLDRVQAGQINLNGFKIQLRQTDKRVISRLICRRGGWREDEEEVEPVETTQWKLQNVEQPIIPNARSINPSRDHSPSPSAIAIYEDQDETTSEQPLPPTRLQASPKRKAQDSIDRDSPDLDDPLIPETQSETQTIGRQYAPTHVSGSVVDEGDTMSTAAPPVSQKRFKGKGKERAEPSEGDETIHIPPSRVLKATHSDESVTFSIKSQSVNLKLGVPHSNYRFPAGQMTGPPPQRSIEIDESVTEDDLEFDDDLPPAEIPPDDPLWQEEMKKWGAEGSSRLMVERIDWANKQIRATVKERKQLLKERAECKRVTNAHAEGEKKCVERLEKSQIMADHLVTQITTVADYQKAVEEHAKGLEAQGNYLRLMADNVNTALRQLNLPIMPPMPNIPLTMRPPFLTPPPTQRPSSSTPSLAGLQLNTPSPMSHPYTSPSGLPTPTQLSEMHDNAFQLALTNSQLLSDAQSSSQSVAASLPSDTDAMQIDRPDPSPGLAPPALTAHAVSLNLDYNSYLTYIDKCSNFMLSTDENKSLAETYGFAFRHLKSNDRFMVLPEIRAAWRAIVGVIHEKGYTLEAITEATTLRWKKGADGGTESLEMDVKTARRLGTYLFVLRELQEGCRSQDDIAEYLGSNVDNRWRSFKSM